MFAGLIGYLAYAETTWGERWFATPYNPRIQNLRADILDRTGLTLVHTEDGEAEYVDDEGQRLAVAHVVGDEYGYAYGAQDDVFHLPLRLRQGHNRQNTGPHFRGRDGRQRRPR